MSTLPLISIITPSYNQGEFLEETIQSVINQNYSNLEYIIIDGGSTDNSVEIIKKYKKHLYYWVSESDNGQSHAINKGLRKATGDIIAWINSDDVYFPHAFEKVNSVFQNNPDIDIIYGNGIWIDKTGTIIRRRKNTNFHYKTWLYGMADPFQPEVFYRKNILTKTGYLDESFHMMMDREWWIRMARSGYNFLYVNDEFAGLRKYENTKSANFQELNTRERWKVHDLYWEGFRFRNKSLQISYWRIINISYRIFRKLKIFINSMVYSD